MTWQLLEIAVYREATGESRGIPFRRGELNIVTGRSQRGKSTILEIVDYCLLADTCRIPKGLVRDTLGAVGILIGKGEDQLACIRWIPEPGKLSSEKCWVDRAERLRLPDSLPASNCSLDVAKEEISSFTGIEDLPLLTKDGYTPKEERPPASIRHVAPYIFQHQDVIGSRNVLFAGIEGFWHHRHLADSLPYFLGVITIERLGKRRQLTELKQRLATERRRIAETARLSSQGFDRGRALWEEARSLGLLYGDSPPSDRNNLADSLRNAQAVPVSGIASDLAERLRELEERERRLLGEQEKLRSARSAASKYLNLSETSVRGSRLLAKRVSIRKLLPPPQDGECPICGNALPRDKWETEIASASSILQAEAEASPRVVSKLQRSIVNAEKQLRAVSDDLKTVRRQLLRSRSLLTEQASQADLQEKRQRLIGRIDEYLRSTSSLLSSFTGSTELLVAEIRKLEEEVGDVAMQRATAEAEDSIAERAQAYASRLDAEFSEVPVRLRLADLRIEFRFDSRWVSLSEIGSGANWLLYHLAVVQALHRAFAENAGPVPRVILLDQPSQAWFPPERAELEGISVPRADADRAAVERVYRNLLEFVEESGYQIVVADHARLADVWFTESVVEDWHEDGALIPSDWMVDV